MHYLVVYLQRCSSSPTGLGNLTLNAAYVDFKKELQSLNRELQLHILELADVLVERPSQYARRVEEISLIFKNLHHLLNSLRPHQVEYFYLDMNYLSFSFKNWLILFDFSLQARATLIHTLELQIERRKQAVEDIKRYNFQTYKTIRLRRSLTMVNRLFKFLNNK